MTAKLYAVPASHPAACAEAALQLKGVPYKRIDLIPHLHRAHQKLRFGRQTVPSLRDGATKIVGSREILQHLDEQVPEPRLYPLDADHRAAVEKAERWADGELQAIVRRLTWLALVHGSRHMTSYTAGSRLPVPQFGVRLTAPVFARLGARLNATSTDTLPADIEALRRALDRIDELIASGVIGSQPPNAADLQIAASLALAATLQDLHPLLADRPAAQLAPRLFPRFPGHMPAGTLPAAERLTA